MTYEPVTVEQADRDAAADFFGQIPAMRNQIGHLQSGDGDTSIVVQAFARHRLSAESLVAKAVAETVERCAKIAENEVHEHGPVIVYAIATAIRSADHTGG